MPEYESFDTFIAFMHEEERTTYTAEELQEMCFVCRLTTKALRAKLSVLGFEVERRRHEKQVRGFTSNPNTRWQDCPSHGGSGGDNIMGFAGRKG